MTGEMVIDYFMQNYASLIASLMAAVTVFAVWKALIPETPFEKRMHGLEKRRTYLMQQNLQIKRQGDRRAMTVGFIRNCVQRMQLLGTAQADKLKLKLAQAGYRSRDALAVYLFVMAFMPMLVGAACAALVYGTSLVSLQPTMKLLVCTVGVFAGYYAPSVFVRNMKDRRMAEIKKSLPDALDLLVICAQAGLSLDAALKRVAHEISAACKELGDEFMLTSVELGFLEKRSEALRNLSGRVDLPAMRSLISTLIQTEKYGTPLAQSLKVLSQEFRNERMMRAEEKAARLPAMLTLPLILFILPPLFIVLLGPAILEAIDAFRNMR